MTFMVSKNPINQTVIRGIVEGFYGRPWSDEDRRGYADILPMLGLNAYLYCPKADPCLRRHWRQHWPAQAWSQLLALADIYARRGLYFGLGLSPFALYRRYGDTERHALKEKIVRLQTLKAPLLAVLFDDMPGDIPDLAQRQAEIVHDIAHWAPELRLFVCPTYYSTDPVLEQYFGHMPEDYWPELGRLLPAGVDIFWTGNQVCSESITRQDLNWICQQLGRERLALWDNYPVNDGAIRSKRLYCQPLADRAPAIRSRVSAHFCNPMNQAYASLPALRGLAELYGVTPAADWEAHHLGHDCWHLLRRDRKRFQEVGLEGMTEGERAGLAQAYLAAGGPAGVEIAAWLKGGYSFDPACLTD
ncbi:MAG: beta-N-acetylglucosaminidase domain-containing protein [Parahaliea sp.]